jgi:hypothetical protein
MQQFVLFLALMAATGTLYSCQSGNSVDEKQVIDLLNGQGPFLGDYSTPMPAYIKSLEEKKVSEEAGVNGENYFIRGVKVDKIIDTKEEQKFSEYSSVNLRIFVAILEYDVVAVVRYSSEEPSPIEKYPTALKRYEYLVIAQDRASRKLVPVVTYPQNYAPGQAISYSSLDQIISDGDRLWNEKNRWKELKSIYDTYK